MLKPSSSPYIPTSQKTQWAWVLERGEEKKVAGDSTVLPAMVWMCPLKIQMLEPYPLKTMILGGGAFGRSFWDFPGRSDSKVSVYNAGGLGSIPGLGRFPGEGNGNPLQYSCLENPMDRGAWCRLLSMGSQRVRHDWTTSLSFFSTVCWTPHCSYEEVFGSQPCVSG